MSTPVSLDWMPSGTPIEARTPTEAAAIFRQNLIDVSQTVLFSGLSGLLASGIDLWRINAEFEMIGLPFRLVAAKPQP